MKKLLTLSIVLALATSMASAQGLRIGLAGAINSTWLFNKNVSDAGDELNYASTFGGTVGVNGVYSFSETTGLSVGILYSGHNQKYEDDPSTYEAKTKLSYLDIPILFRLQSPSGPYFEVGPQIGILMGAKADFSTKPASGFDFSDLDVKEFHESTNIAIVFGFGVDIEASENIVVSTGLRFGYGFTDVMKDDKEPGYEPTNRVFGGLALGVAYKLN